MKKQISEKQKALNKEYKKNRARIQRYIRDYMRMGYDVEYVLPKIPKTITQSSINKLARITKKEFKSRLERLILKDTGEILEGREARQYEKVLRKQEREARKERQKQLEPYGEELEAVPTVGIVAWLKSKINGLPSYRHMKGRVIYSFEPIKLELITMIDKYLELDYYSYVEYLYQNEEELALSLGTVYDDSNGNNVRNAFNKVSKILNYNKKLPRHVAEAIADYMEVGMEDLE